MVTEMTTPGAAKPQAVGRGGVRWFVRSFGERGG